MSSTRKQSASQRHDSRAAITLACPACRLHNGLHQGIYQPEQWPNDVGSPP